MSSSHLWRTFRASRTLAQWSLAVTVLLVAGCGYSLVGRATSLPEDIRRIAVEPFGNQTTRAEVEQFITRAVTAELLKRPRFALVGAADEADAVLVGSVTSFSVTPLTFDAEGRAEEYEISILAQVRFERPARGDQEAAVVWKNDRYVFRDSYELGGSEADFFDRENIAIEESAERFARTLVADLLEGF